MTAILYDQHIISMLTHFYLDEKAVSEYHGRWDTYLAANGKWDEFFYLMLKTDTQLSRLIELAQEEAKSISTSPLAKAMKEDE